MTAAKSKGRTSPEKRNDVADAAEVEQWILEELGEPANLLRIEAKPLWDDYFRVNVYTRTDVGLTAKEVAVSDSFFVFKSEAGFLSDPPIARKYELV
jgi:hypothetical protein